MASRVWSSDDLQVLEQHAANDDWRNALSNLFAEAIPASQRLLEATLRVGRWS
jgi:hypothetical protein